MGMLQASLSFIGVFNQRSIVKIPQKIIHAGTDNLHLMSIFRVKKYNIFLNRFMMALKTIYNIGEWINFN